LREKKEFNNLIAFVGERGTGKSSAMITMANLLANNKLSQLNESGIFDYNDNYNFRFQSIHSIDPTRFEDGQNIIEIIVAELFQKFQVILKNALPRRNDSCTREVLKNFQDVYKSLKTIKKSDHHGKYDGDPLETLSELADATNLEENLSRLFSSYLKYIHPNNAENSSILVIPIDDFDLNVKHALVMAEQIRKYLMIPQILILLAVNIEQLADLKTQEILTTFQTLIKETDAGMYESPRDCASRYLHKLLPTSRRIVIPTLKFERNSLDFRILKNDKQPLIEGQNDHVLEKIIFDFIFNHTGLYFVSNPERLHLLISDNLREFMSFCKVLGDFKLGETANESQYKLENIKLFENYFVNTWTKDRLLIPFRKLLMNTQSVPYKSWNKFVVTSIVEILANEEVYEKEWKNPNQNIFKDDTELQYITDCENYASNVSLGDLIYFMSFLERVYLKDNEIKKLLFAINCLYSITLNKLNINNEIGKIKDVVNGTVLNRNEKVLPKRNSISSRIQLQLDNYPSNIATYNDYVHFINQLVFIPYQLKDKNYRTDREDITLKDIFEDQSDRFHSPTINLFSFIGKGDNFIFSIPFNNMELWIHILNKVNIDTSSLAKRKTLGEASYIGALFEEIYNKLDNQQLKDNFFNHNFVNYFLTIEKGKAISKFSDEIAPNWIKFLMGEIAPPQLPNLNKTPTHIDEIFQFIEILRKTKFRSYEKVISNAKQIIKTNKDALNIVILYFSTNTKVDVKRRNELANTLSKLVPANK
jgi:hypothetical protein